MQVFKTFFKIVKKNMVSIVMYLAIFLFISIVLVDQGYKGAVTNKKIAIFNYDDKSEFSNNLTKFLSENTTVIKIDDDKEAIQDALYYGKVSYIVKIPTGFSDNFKKNNSDVELEKMTVAGSIDSVYIDNLINKYLNFAKTYLNNIPNISDTQLSNYLENDMKNQTQITVNSYNAENANTKYNYYFNYFAYLSLMVIISIITQILITFNNTEIKTRNLCSPIKLLSYNFQLILGSVIFVVSLLFVVCVFSLILYGNEMTNITNNILFFINALMMCLVALSISFLIGNLIKNKEVISPISTMISLGLCFTTGVFVPQEIMSSQVLKIASFTPTYWYVKVINNIKSLTVYDFKNITPIIYGFIIQLGFAVAIILIALVILKQKRSSNQIN